MNTILKKIKNENIIIFSDLTFLLLQSNFKKIFNDVDNFIDILIKNQNTIILPAFNLNFPSQKKTSFQSNFITTGYFNKYLIDKISFIRSQKPVYNYAMFGPNAKKIQSLGQSTAFGYDSVIGYLSKNKTFAFGIGINPKNFNWVTLHVCEELSKVPYRFFKNFKGKNTDTNKIVNEKIYVRYKNKKIENTGYPIYLELIEKKKIINLKFNSLDFVCLNLNDYFKIGMRLLKKNKYGLTI